MILSGFLKCDITGKGEKGDRETCELLLEHIICNYVFT
jgi:hypothetical protein